MGVDGGITSSTSQVLVLTVWDVEVSLWVSVLLGQTKINDVDLVTTLTNAHEEVVRLDITMDEGFGVDVFDTGDELIGEKKNSLQGELAVAEVEEILQTGSEKVKDHSIVITFGTEPANERDTDTTGEGFVDTSLIFELRMLSLDRLKLDSNLFTRDDVGTKVDITKGTTTDLSTNAVFITHAKILQRDERLALCNDDDVSNVINGSGKRARACATLLRRGCVIFTSPGEGLKHAPMSISSGSDRICKRSSSRTRTRTRRKQQEGVYEGLENGSINQRGCFWLSTHHSSHLEVELWTQCIGKSDTRVEEDGFDREMKMENGWRGSDEI